MKNNHQLIAIRENLLAFGNLISIEALLPTIVPEASPFVATDPYAFAIALCLDRGMKAEIIWTMPYYIKRHLGHLDPRKIYKMSIDEITQLFAQLPQRPRYVNDAPKTIRDLTRVVMEECNGDASLIWMGKPAADVKRTLLSIHGVGPGIANMGVLLIEKAFHVRFTDLDHTKMDIKPDVHTVRVLYRLGVSDAQSIDAAITAARGLNPEFPGGTDAALWEIGRKFCFASNPNCTFCPMQTNCSKLIA